MGDSRGRTTIDFDAHDGSLKFVSLPTGQRSGETLPTILVELHMANIFGLAYKLFVAVFALSIIAISASGISIWALKRHDRPPTTGPVGMLERIRLNPVHIPRRRSSSRIPEAGTH